MLSSVLFIADDTPKSCHSIGNNRSVSSPTRRTVRVHSRSFVVRFVCFLIIIVLIVMLNFVAIGGVGHHIIFDMLSGRARILNHEVSD